MSPEITFTAPPAEDQESIFDTTEHTGDDLFGSGSGPKIEMPPELNAASASAKTTPVESAPNPASAASSSIFSSAGMGGPEAPPAEQPPAETPARRQQEPTGLENPEGSAAETWTGLAQPGSSSGVLAAGLGPPASAVEQATANSPEAHPALAFLHGPGGKSTDTADASAMPADSFLRHLPRRSVPSGMRGSMFIALVVIPLISYAILATIAVLILYLRPPQPSLEYLPDVEGDLQGARRQKHSSTSYERLDPDAPLPDRLKIDLKHSLRLGDVEVTPLRVEWSPLKIRHPDLTEDLLGEALVLHLKLKNVSQDVAFSPTDPYFDRQWKSTQDSKPYTFLEIGKERIVGGPLPWQAGRRLDERPVLEGQVYQVLPPGAQIETFVCTPPGDVTIDRLAELKEPLLWRVQVRRGLVHVGARDVPATAVVGVEFRSADIQKPL